MNRALESIVEQEIDAQGYDLVQLRQGGTRSRPVLEVRIDRRDGEGVSIADCVRVSRAVEARLGATADRAVAFGGGRYELQVSSPGEARRARPVTAAPSADQPAEVVGPGANLVTGEGKHRRGEQ